MISGQWAESSFRRPSTAAEPATSVAADASGAAGLVATGAVATTHVSALASDHVSKLASQQASKSASKQIALRAPSAAPSPRSPPHRRRGRERTAPAPAPTAGRHWRHRRQRRIDASLTGARKNRAGRATRDLRLAGGGAIVPVEVPAALLRAAKVPVNWVQGRNWDRVPPSPPTQAIFRPFFEDFPSYLQMNLRYRVRWQRGVRSELFRLVGPSDHPHRLNECTGFPGV